MEAINSDIHSTYADTHIERETPRGNYLFVLSLAALGVVYGDIGTSPLYALRECFHGAHAIAPTPANILGVLSLIFWSLVIVISIKYLAWVMRADNRGEGGILRNKDGSIEVVRIRRASWNRRTDAPAVTVPTDVNRRVLVFEELQARDESCKAAGA